MQTSYIEILRLEKRTTETLFDEIVEWTQKSLGKFRYTQSNKEKAEIIVEKANSRANKDLVKYRVRIN